MPYIFAPTYGTAFERLEQIRIFEERSTAATWVKDNLANPKSAVTFEALNPHHWLIMEFFSEGGSAEIGRLLFHPYIQGN